METGACSNSSKSLASVTRTGLPLLTAALSGPLAKLSIKKLNHVIGDPACAGEDRDADNKNALAKADGPDVVDSVAAHTSIRGSHNVGCLGPGPNNDTKATSEVSELYVEHGLAPMSDLSPHCGRYEFKDNGKVVAWDALVSTQLPEQLVGTLAKGDRTLKWNHPAEGVWLADRSVLGKEQHVQVHASSTAKLPENCRALSRTVRAVVIVAETL